MDFNINNGVYVYIIYMYISSDIKYICIDETNIIPLENFLLKQKKKFL